LPAIWDQLSPIPNNQGIPTGGWPTGSGMSGFGTHYRKKQAGQDATGSS
jgi:hypothetical protein